MLVLNTAVEDIETQKATDSAGNIQIVSHDILDERATAWTALDIDGLCARTGEFAMLDPHIANAAGRFAANSNARKNRIGHRAVRDEHVLGGLQQRVGFLAASALDGDAIVAGRDVAAFIAEVPARFDFDSFSIPCVAAIGQVLVEHVLAVGGMQGTT